MRIISQKAPVTEIEVTCQDPSCGTVCECDKSDFRYFDDQRDGEAIMWVCPTCGRNNWTSTSGIPRSFVRSIQR